MKNKNNEELLNFLEEIIEWRQIYRNEKEIKNER